MKLKNYLKITITLLCFLTGSFFTGQEARAQIDTSSENFENIRMEKDWKLEMQDRGNLKWKKKWFLDGLRGEVMNTDEGMVLAAGPVEKDDACHAVLWTKKSFTGDIRIEYEYTRMDTREKQVNILYIQATGKGAPDYPEDITAWSKNREIPYMSTYFQNMKLLHISYAAFAWNDPMWEDYIRARVYPVPEGAKFHMSTEIPPSYYDTGLFKPGVKYKITVIKTGNILFFNVEGDSQIKLFSWDLTHFPEVISGRVGLRHMYTRVSRYSNFKIYTRSTM